MEIWIKVLTINLFLWSLLHDAFFWVKNEFLLVNNSIFCCFCDYLWQRSVAYKDIYYYDII